MTAGGAATTLCLAAACIAMHAPASAQQFKTGAYVPAYTRIGPGDPHCKKPEYPKASMRDEEQGTVTLEFLIDVDGSLLGDRIVKSSGHTALDVAAMVALRQCAFKVVETNGARRKAWLRMSYVWSIKD
ncbi:energy transducer TonB [Massilia glaciei]|uniref:Energy transducer TonB n=1 Tax=Massilia glaciei TaxID=1524097 RepID=A0A2U2HNS8_9BURK|nr:energy transducer TonB [Massilia glaciei]